MKVIFKNSSLIFKAKPVKIIVEKSYAKTTQNEQYVFIANQDSSVNSAIESLALNNIKVEVSAILADASATKPCLFSTRQPAVITKYSNKLHSDMIFSSSSTSVKDATVGIHTFGVNTKECTSYIDSETFEAEPYTTDSPVMYAVIFSRYNNGIASNWSNAGAWKLAYCKIWNATTNELVSHIVPATADGVPCLYDKVTGEDLYPNEGSLVVE